MNYFIDHIWDIIQGTSAAGSLLVSVFVYPIIRVLHKLRTNDLAHLDQKLDGIRDSVDRVEGKVDKHLDWHLDHLK